MDFSKLANLVLGGLVGLVLSGAVKLYSDVTELRVIVTKLEKELGQNDDRGRKYDELTARIEERVKCAQEK